MEKRSVIARLVGLVIHVPRVTTDTLEICVWSAPGATKHRVTHLMVLVAPILRIQTYHVCARLDGTPKIAVCAHLDMLDLNVSNALLGVPP
jgi:hypothetical protein